MGESPWALHVRQHLGEGFGRPGVKLAAVHLGKLHGEVLGQPVLQVHQPQVPGGFLLLLRGGRGGGFPVHGDARRAGVRSAFRRRRGGSRLAAGAGGGASGGAAGTAGKTAQALPTSAGSSQRPPRFRACLGGVVWLHGKDLLFRVFCL